MIFIKKRKNAPTPIETSLGILKGRDCIYLDKVYKKDRSYLFEGEINGRLLNNSVDRYIKYKLEFKNVISMFSCELDSYDAINTNSVYSFEIIEDSKYLKKLSADKKFVSKAFKRFRFKTYDDIFDIIAKDYALEIK